MEKGISKTDLATAHKNINEALRNIYLLRLSLSKQIPCWPLKLQRMELELFNLLREIESQK